MRSHRWGRLSAGIVLTFAAVAALPVTGAHAAGSPGQAGAACAWVASDLPLPAGITSGDVVRGDAEGNRYAGSVLRDQFPRRVGVVWESGVPRVLGHVDFRDTSLVDVNAAGVAVGSVSDGISGWAVRNRDGVYESNSAMIRADDVNSAGQAAGPGTVRGQVVVWGLEQTRVLTLPGDEAVGLAGIDDAGRVFATSTLPNAYVWSAAGERTRVAPVTPGGWVEVRAIAAGRLVGRSGGASGPTYAVEWDVTGRVVRTLPGGEDASAVNANTLVLGKTSVSDLAVWRDGAFAGALQKPAGATAIYASSISDNGVVAGTYTVGTRRVPALWTCV